jgi:hypothetical protein
MADWQPIETAPPYPTRVDLWAVSTTNPAGRRRPNCIRAYSQHDAWIDEDGKYVNGLHYVDDEGDTCFAPGSDPKPAEVRHIRSRIVVTHWMPLPAAPLISE